MASIYQTKSGYRAQVFVAGERDTKSFRTKREAQAWAAARETELRTLAVLEPGDKHTLGDAFDRYAEEVAPGHKGERWEVVRLKLFAKQLPVNEPIGKISATDIAAWRDERLKTVAASSVLREMKLLNSVFEVARKEWRWIGLNPVHDVRKPRSPEHRKRTIAWWEIKRQIKAMGYSPRKPIRTIAQATAMAFLVALRTGMRASELTELTWDRVHDRRCHLPVTKSTSRDVSVSRKAARLLERMRGWDEELVFGLRSQTLDALFRRYRQRAGLEGFTFHDSRHTAATWLARKLEVLDLCKMFGWSNPKMAMVYYNPTAEDIADRLD